MNYPKKSISVLCIEEFVQLINLLMTFLVFYGRGILKILYIVFLHRRKKMVQ